MQNLMQHHGIGGAIRQRYIIKIAVADLRVGEPCPLELHSRVSQHGVVEIEAERA
jgi:hypothetical protein